MNSSNNSEIFFSKDFWLTQYISTWLFDSIYLFAITPVGLVGFILNSLSFYVLMHSEFTKLSQIYIYFRVITLNSALLNLFQASLFLSMTYRYLEFTNSFEALTYGSQVYLPTTSFLYLFGSCLDIFISLERCSIFITQLKLLLKYRPMVMCLALFFASFLIHIPYYFVNSPSYFDAPLDANTYYRIWYFDLTEFGKSSTGQIITYIIYFIKDVLCLIIELVLSILSIVLFKKYFKNKANNKKIVPALPNSFDSDLNMDAKTVIQLAQQEKLNSKDKNVTFMVIVMCAFSILMHIMYLVLSVYFSFTVNDFTVNYLAVVAFFICTLKNFSNFLFLYLFNINFRKSFRKHVLNKKIDQLYFN